MAHGHHHLSFRDAPPTSGLPEFGNIIVQVGNSRLRCAGPESILPVVVMDSGFARKELAPRNDGRMCGETVLTSWRTDRT
jgi:hypothetical protein